MDYYNGSSFISDSETKLKEKNRENGSIKINRF